MSLWLAPARLFDGERLHSGLAVGIDGGRIGALRPAAQVPQALALPGLLAPGFVDLQVNGGAGRMIDAAIDAPALREILAAHAALGATTILPTLITDRPAAVRAAIAAALGAEAAGLHLEGPHLDPRRAGAHPPALIRPMTEADLALYCETARRLPLKITLAPAAARPEQVARLAAAGVLVALGHAEARFEEAEALLRAGARLVTHLFNAMSPMAGRAPGLVGAALALPFHAGLIADGHHVAPAAAQVALAASDRIFLVSDAMAVAGTALPGFRLHGRPIVRAGGRLTLADGTLAGADLSLAQAVANVVGWGVPLARALAMAGRGPADLLGRADLGRIAPGARADLVLLGADLRLARVWRGGEEIAAGAAAAQKTPAPARFCP